MPSKTKLIKIILLFGAVYFFIASLAHFFGWTLFPFYDGALYSPYHDTLLALCDLIFCLIFLTVAKDPIKNNDTLLVIKVALVLTIIFNIGIIWKINFAALGSTQKLFQTKIETALAIIMLASLILFRPKNKN